MESAGRVSEEDEDNGEPTPGTAAWLVAYYPPFDAAYTCGTVSVLMDREHMKNQPDWWTTHEKEGEEEARHQVALVHCLFGNPFQPASIDLAVLAWNDHTIPNLARAIYEERAFNRLSTTIP